MAQGGRKAPGKKTGKQPGVARPTPPEAKPVAKPTPDGTKGRQSVAASRNATPTSNRTQLIIGGIAVALIVAVVVVGVIMNRKNNKIPEDGYGAAKAATATVADNIVTIGSPTATVTIDLFADAMCPVCREFEAQFGQQMNKAADDGKLAIRLRMLDFLNQTSASKDYSTRAAAAVLTVAKHAGDKPGVVAAYFASLLSEANQPEEGGTTDHTNEQLADLAVAAGAPESVRADIVAGTDLEAAKAALAASRDTLSAAIGGVATPSVLKDGAPVEINTADWLTDLLAAG